MGAKIQIKWTAEEDKRLIQLCLTHTNSEISRVLSKSKSSVANRMRYLGKPRPKEVSEAHAKRSRFYPGQPPWNKGKKGTHFSPDTEFKKGCVPHNTKTDGYISIRSNFSRKQKYKYIRTGKGKWIELHRWMWEQVYGQLPKGAVLRFKNGDQLDCRLSNLMLIDRKTHLLLNNPIDSDKRVLMHLKVGKDNWDRVTKEYPDIIELKRQQLKLKKEIRNAR
jgi:hypothetical protein